MDTYIDGRFERLEKALANLIDSVTKFHPSIHQGDELDAADKELTKGLEEGSLLWPNRVANFEPVTDRDISANSPEQLPTYTTTARILSSPRYPDPRNTLQPRDHSQGYCHDAHHNLPRWPYLCHRLRGAAQLC